MAQQVWLFVAALWVLALGAAFSLAAATPARALDVCEAALRPAAERWGVPKNVMRAIALTETGRVTRDGPRAAPWAINASGTSHWFTTRDEALAFIRGERAAQRHSFDVGCFQVNYRWHGRAFRSLEEMIDPAANAAYAARFLASLYAEFGDWSRAAGAYHSRTPHYARVYRARFDRWRARLAEQPAPIAPALALAREATPPARGYVLLQSGRGSLSSGSLVPDVAPLDAFLARASQALVAAPKRLP